MALEALDVRPIEAGDKEALAAGVGQSSNKSVYQRFLSAHPRLTAAELRYFTEVDHHDHEALIAMDPVSGNSIAVARYVRDPEREASAEIAVLVLDAWQGRGVGKLLLRRLADRARAEGIRRFTGIMMAENRPMRHLFEDLGETVLLATAPGTIELGVDLRS
jgi:GNAT superfamily N-acetyltransferase